MEAPSAASWRKEKREADQKEATAAIWEEKRDGLQQSIEDGWQSEGSRAGSRSRKGETETGIEEKRRGPLMDIHT